MQNFIENHLKKISILSILLYPFSIIYGLIQLMRRSLYNQSKRYISYLKVISIGNITAGGSGKTPFTIYLAKKLTAAGYRVAVSHRGYKGKFEKDNRIISDEKGLRPEASKAGDEALLLAEKLLGIPVIAGKNRQNSLKKLEKEIPGLEIVIMDDSFQHLRVKHDHDFVVFNQAGGIGNGLLLPAGILREPLSALKAADTIIYNGEGKLPEYLKKFRSKVMKGHYEQRGIFIDNVHKMDISELRNTKLAIVSGIGNPKSFENTIRRLELKWQEHITYPDHYHYNNEAILKLNEHLEKAGIEYVLTTEKDHTKLRKAEICCPLLVLRIEFCLNEDTLLADLFLPNSDKPKP